MNKYDTIVVGAGVAGLAAAQRLHCGGQSVLVLEARDRIGGRIHTDYDFAAHPVELGAEFVHGAVVTRRLAERYGLDLMPVLADDRGYLHQAQGLIKLADDTLEVHRVRDVLQSNGSKIWDWAAEWVAQGQPDTDVATMVRSRGLRFEPDVAQVISHTYSADYGVYWDQLSVYGLVENTYAGDGCDEFRIRQGYGAWLQRFAQGLNIQCNMIVGQVDWQEKVCITTDDGVLIADRVVVTLPLALLRNQAVQFTPELPDWKRQAIDHIGIAHIIKLILKFDRAFWPENWEHCHTYLDTQLWWRSGYGFDHEEPVITAFMGAAACDSIRALGAAGAASIGVTHLAEIFGVDVRDRLVNAQLVDWQADPFAQMGYSVTTVGETGWRAKLAQSIDGKLFFAGEAASVLRPASVHGAIETGYAAAAEILGEG